MTITLKNKKTNEIKVYKNIEHYIEKEEIYILNNLIVFKSQYWLIKIED